MPICRLGRNSLERERSFNVNLIVKCIDDDRRSQRLLDASPVMQRRRQTTIRREYVNDVAPVGLLLFFN